MTNHKNKATTGSSRKKAKPTSPRTARFLTNRAGEVQFVVIHDADTTTSLTGDVYVVEVVADVARVVEAMTDPETATYWYSYVSAEEYASVYLKWDGCSHYQSKSGTAMQHLCGRESWILHLALMEHLYTLAHTLIPEAEAWKNDGWYQEMREPVRSPWSQELLLAETVVSLPDGS